MDPPAKSTLRAIYLKVSALPAAQRDAALLKLCAGRADILKGVRALLDADTAGDATRTGSSLPPELSIDAQHSAPNAQVEEKPGSYIGPYKLLQQIGEGGFGSVFIAQQDRPVRRTVALKIIKLGMDTRQVVARFEQERQALALTDHPNIAHVLDAGATNSGRPYFVMELCRGEPITVYCDKNNLSVQDRLSLFVQVCQAIQHAHHKGLIHRDIKPSNVLVTTRDDKPVVKVIDFGIAKATASKLTDQTLFTVHQQMIGTPQYMSPEQAEGSLDIDTRTDVYSLGVLLYELLTGVTPFDSRTLRSAALAEIQRIIREVEPPKPSTRLSQDSATAVGIAQKRRTEPSKLDSILRGELDWIVMKALEKDRQRRYETANSLAMDVQRYQSGDAVIAAPPSTVYRLRKLIQRNRGLFTAAAAVMLALLAGVIACAWQMRIAQHERDIAQKDRNRAVVAEEQAKQRADELTKVSNFQSNMLSQINPTSAGVDLMNDIRARFNAALVKSGVSDADRPVHIADFTNELSSVNATDTAAQMIDRTILKPAIRTIDLQFADQPLVNAQLCQSLAELYLSLELYDESLPLAQHALAIRQKVLGDRDPQTLISMESVAKPLRILGKSAEAEPLERQALETMRQVRGLADPQTLGCEVNLGILLREQGKLDESAPLLIDAVETGRRVLGDRSNALVVYLLQLSMLYQDRGDYAQAVSCVREAIAINARIEPPGSSNSLSAVNSLASLYIEQGKWTEAEPLLRQTLEGSRKVRGEDNPKTITCMMNLAVLLQRMKNSVEAEPLFREALQKRRRIFGNDSPETLESVSGLADCLREQNRLDESLPLAREAMDGLRRVRGDDHMDTLKAINVYGFQLVKQKKYAEAEVYWREVYDRGRRVFGATHPDVLVWTNNLGRLLIDQHKLDQAEPLLRQAMDSSRTVMGMDHPTTIVITKSLCDVLEFGKRYAELMPLYRAVSDSRRRASNPDPDPLRSAIDDLARTLENLEGESLAQALSLYEESIALSTKKYGNHHWSVGIATARRGRTLMKLHRFAEAEEAITAGFQILKTPSEASMPGRRSISDLLVTFYQTWDNADPGKGHDSKAVEWKAVHEKLLAATQPTR